MLDWQRFRQPEAADRIHPFWFWNGEMDDDRIREQIAEMADKGLGGFFVCARQGMTVAYLSDEWFRKVRIAVEAAQRHGLNVWLYDEYPYPSGIAGGEVTLELPEAKHYSLVHHSQAVAGGERISLELPWARILYAKAVPVTPEGRRNWSEAISVRSAIGNWQADPVFQKTGLTAYNRKRFFTYRTVQRLDWTAPEGEWEVLVVQEKEIEDFKYYGTFVDPCNREAMAAFIRLTHDRYAERLGDYFGTTIKGMFTDEIGLLGSIPWSPRLADFFRERCGYELRDHLYALLDPEAEDAARIRYDYYQSIHLLLRDSYHKQVHDWCERHGLQYVAEVPSVRHTTQLYSHVPGGDTAHEKLGRPLEWILNKEAASFRANAKMISSLARQLNRERNLIECFHSVGWSMTLQDARWMIDRMASQGTNFFNFHAFFYTVDGLAQHDAPPSQFWQNPYWKHFRQLGDYVGRISYAMSSGEAVISVAVLQPTTSLWSMMGNPFHAFSYGGARPEEKRRLELLRSWWGRICNHLTLGGRDFDQLDPELLAEADIADGRITLGKAGYSVLILPPMTNLESAAWAKIDAFLRQGGIVVGMGRLACERIEPHGPDPRDIAAAFGLAEPAGASFWQAAGEAPPQWRKGERAAYYLPFAAEADAAPVLQALSELLDRLSPAPVRLSPACGELGLLMQARRIADDTVLVFVSNQEAAAREVTLHAEPRLWGIGRDSAGPAVLPRVRELSLDSGEAAPLASQWQANGACLVPLRLAPYEARLLELKLDRQAEGLAAESPAGGGQAAEGPAGGGAERVAEATAGRAGRLKEAAADPAGDLKEAVANPISERREAAGEPANRWAWEADAAGPWELKALGPNALRMDMFRLEVYGPQRIMPAAHPDEAGLAADRSAPADAAASSVDGSMPAGIPAPIARGTVMAKTFIDQCADLAEAGSLPVGMRQTFGTPMSIGLAYPLAAVYTAEFTVEDLPESAELLMDRSAVCGDAVIKVNGRTIAGDEFRPTFLYDHNNVSADISAHLLPGASNMLTVEVRIERDFEGIVDALYIVGPFAVRFDGEGRPVLSGGQPDARPIDSLRAGPYPGYPYYAGDFSFAKTVTVHESPDPDADEFELTFPGLDPDFHDCAEVLVNGRSLGVRAWSPYRWRGDASFVRQGDNRIEVRVTNTLIGMLEGSYFDYREHAVKPVCGRGELREDDR